MSWLSSLFGGHNPADAAKPYYDQMQGQYLNPDYYNQIAGQYKQSPGFDWRMQQAMSGIKNAQGAAGMLGTNQHQQTSAQMAEGLANQDFESYMKDRMGLGSDMAGISSQQGQLAAGGAGFKNKHMMDILNMLFSAGGAVGGSALGPAGSAIGQSLGNWVGKGLGNSQDQSGNYYGSRWF